MSKQTTALMWFRQDCRLQDNPALIQACDYDRVLAIYIDDHDAAYPWHLGKAARQWLYHALYALNAQLNDQLNIFQGDALSIIQKLVKAHDIDHVFWNRCYEPWRLEQDKMIEKQLVDMHVGITTTNGSLLWEPWTISKDDGTPYQVFTPFYRKGCLKSIPPRRPYDIIPSIHAIKDKRALNIENLKPKDQDLPNMTAYFSPGEQGGQAQVKTFIDHHLEGYKKGRDFPAKKHVSRLSPHIHWGHVSVHQLWHACRDHGDDDHIEHFCSELGWREFSHYQLYHFQQLPWENRQAKFNRFVFKNNKARFKAWQEGKTGVPLVDAGMRQLKATGYMHNRLRMITGSFLVKNLCIDWRWGQQWFWDHLYDADLANNSASWQWVAGCGADAAPYFRIFNPVLQGQRFDPQGEFTTHWVSELSGMPMTYLFNPWQATQEVLQQASVILGKDYPHPIVDLAASRDDALAAFAKLKEQSG